MYYPIIDKLKTLMTDIASVKEKEPLIIEGTITNPTNYAGTWVGEWSDVLEAFRNGQPVLFCIKQTFPTIEININTQLTICANMHGSSPISALSTLSFIRNGIAYIEVKNDNTYSLILVGG